MKKIFYYTDVLPFLTREGEAIDKLKRNFEIFKDASENIRVVWHPLVGITKSLELSECPVAEEYKQIVEDFRSAGWGDFDETERFDEIRELMLTCNGYYGDMSDLVYDAQNAGIPVMIQNVSV